jgi:hypothetical protein
MIGNTPRARGSPITAIDGNDGSLTGTTMIAVRTHGGFCWAALTNTSRDNSKIGDDLDTLNWDMVGEVKSWHVA